MCTIIVQYFQKFYYLPYFDRLFVKKKSFYRLVLVPIHSRILLSRLPYADVDTEPDSIEFVIMIQIR
jgi:hypothetical protein